MISAIFFVFLGYKTVFISRFFNNEAQKYNDVESLIYLDPKIKNIDKKYIRERIQRLKLNKVGVVFEFFEKYLKYQITALDNLNNGV